MKEEKQQYTQGHFIGIGLVTFLIAIILYFQIN